MQKSGSFLLKAGTAKKDITGTAAGTHVNDALYARVLILDNGVKFVFISLDILAIREQQGHGDDICDTGENFIGKLRSRISKNYKIPECSILLNASHNHSPGQPECGDKLIGKISEAVGDALKDMKPARIGSGTGREDRISMNRILRLKNRQHWTVRMAYPSPPDEEIESTGPVDPAIGLIKIERSDGGAPAVIYNFACHPIGYFADKISANFPGVASNLIEEQLGKGSTALFLQGAAGDIIDISYKNFKMPGKTEIFGERLGLGVLNSIGGISAGPNVKIKTVSEAIDLPLKIGIQEDISLLKQKQEKMLSSLRLTSFNLKNFMQLYPGYVMNPNWPADYSYVYFHKKLSGSRDLHELDENNRKYLEKYIQNIYIMEKLAKLQDDITVLEKQHRTIRALGKDRIKAELQLVRIGDCIIVSSPAELLTEVSLNIKKASPLEKTFVVSYSNGNIRYSPPASYYGKGSYEAYASILAPEWQKIFEKKAAGSIANLLEIP